MLTLHKKHPPCLDFVGGRKGAAILCELLPAGQSGGGGSRSGQPQYGGGGQYGGQDGGYPDYRRQGYGQR